MSVSVPVRIRTQSGKSGKPRRTDFKGDAEVEAEAEVDGAGELGGGLTVFA